MNNFNKSNGLSGQYKQALNYTSAHYENFPVASFLIPKHLRKHVAVIYKFARTADDIADEGDLTVEQRLEKLDEYENMLRQTLASVPVNPFWAALKNTVTEFNLSSKYLFDLLSAFKQDVIQNRYSDFDELLDYCSRSANPVGRLILELWQIENEKAKYYSDKICTALQLTNFYQDVSVDLKKGRIYIPLDELNRFGISENDFFKSVINDKFKKLMIYQIDRTEKLFNEGEGIFDYLSGMLKYEIAWTVLGGKKILYKIKKNDYNVLKKRPALHKFDFIGLFFKAFVK